MFKYLTITGTMGSGKTTVAQLLSKRLDFHLLEENFGENAFLPRFYDDMQRWAFHSQTFYVMEKITQLRKTKKLLETTSVVQDTPIQQDVFSYAFAQHKLGNMDDAEWQLYLTIYRSFAEFLPKPTHVIYLKTLIPVLEKRIADRKRSFEKELPKGYLQLLDKLNEEWMQKEIDGMKLLTIETDQIYLVHNTVDQENLVEKVRQFIK